MLKKALLPTADSVPGDAVAGTSRFMIPTGRRVHGVFLDAGDTADEAYTALLGDIRVKLNGRTQREFTAAHLDAMNSVNGAKFAVPSSGSTSKRQTIPIFFAEPWRKNIAQAQAGAWNLDPTEVDGMAIEVDWLTGSHAGKVISGWYEYDELQGKLGTITKVTRQYFANSGAQNDFNLMTAVPRGDAIQAIHLMPSTDRAVMKVKLTANGVIRQDLIDYLQQVASLNFREMAPAAWSASTTPNFDLVFDYDDPLQSALFTANLSDLTLQCVYGVIDTTTAAITYSAGTAGSVPCHIIHFGPPR